MKIRALEDGTSGKFSETGKRVILSYFVVLFVKGHINMFNICICFQINNFSKDKKYRLSDLFFMQFNVILTPCI